MSSNVVCIRFDDYLVKNKAGFLQELANFYCNIWRYDPNFGEYKKCPDEKNCGKYFDYDYFENKGNRTCSTCGKPLVDAWVETSVEETILKRTSLGNNFYGAVAVDTITERIVGFVWGYNRPLAEVETQKLLEVLNNETGYVPYFNEIAVDPKYRGQLIGSTLCKMLVSWMKQNYPNTPGYLHTHSKSVARHVFDVSGYRYHSEDEKLGDGRIYMVVDQCKDFTPENLKSI